jgi:hypothetical protein
MKIAIIIISLFLNILILFMLANIRKTYPGRHYELHAGAILSLCALDTFLLLVFLTR